MPNKPRPDNPHRMVRVEDELWGAACRAAAQVGTTRSEVMREALRALVARPLSSCDCPRGLGYKFHRHPCRRAGSVDTAANG